MYPFLAINVEFGFENTGIITSLDMYILRTAVYKQSPGKPKKKKKKALCNIDFNALNTNICKYVTF